MTVYTIRLPDASRGDDLRPIVWDDEAGTVTGEHSDVPQLQEALAEPVPVVLPHITGPLTLRDPGHDPADFIALLATLWWEFLVEPGRSAFLPLALQGVTPTQRAVRELPPGVLA